MTLDELIKTLQEIREHAPGDVPTLIFGREVTAKQVTQVEEVAIKGNDTLGILLS